MDKAPPNELTDGNGDYRNTILYRNAQAVMDTLQARESELAAMRIEQQRLTAQVTQLQTAFIKTEHMVDTMFARTMGQGSTEPE